MESIEYYRNDNNCHFMQFDKEKNILVSVDLYTFNTGINMCNLFNLESRLVENVIECTKLEFDKAFHLALALISNKSLNT
jgi:hypothetical protein